MKFSFGKYKGRYIDTCKNVLYMKKWLESYHWCSYQEIQEVYNRLDFLRNIN